MTKKNEILKIEILRRYVLPPLSHTLVDSRPICPVAPSKDSPALSKASATPLEWPLDDLKASGAGMFKGAGFGIEQAPDGSEHPALVAIGSTYTATREHWLVRYSPPIDGHSFGVEKVNVYWKDQTREGFETVKRVGFAEEAPAMKLINDC